MVTPTAPTPVVKPTRLTVLASQVWDELAPIAIKLGTLTAADVVAFATLCELEADRWTITKSKDEKDFAALITARDYKGNTALMASGALGAERDAISALSTWLSKFGLEPRGHGRRQIVKPSAPAVPVKTEPKKADVRDFAKRAQARLKLANSG